MVDTIIGGAIAAVIGALTGLGVSLFLNYQNKKKEQALIVNDLLVEMEANLKICRDPASAKMWWMVLFKTEAYNSYKGKITFLPGEVRNALSEIVHMVEGVNTAIEVQNWRSGCGIAEPQEFRPIEHPDYLKQWLTSCRDELQNWRKQRSSKRTFWRINMRQSQIWIPVLYAVGVAFFAVSAMILHSYHQFPEGIGWFNAVAGLTFIIGGGVWAFLAGRRQS